MNTPLRDELKKIEVDCYDGYVLLKRVPLSDEQIDQILSLIESKMPEKKKPSDKDFSLDEGINPTYDEDGDLVDFGRPPQKHKMNRPYNDGWNAYHDKVKSILKGSDDN